MDNEMPIEMAVEEIKASIVKYANGLCQQYSVPSIIMMQILQEIVYENRINMLSSVLAQIRMTTLPKQEIDISTDQLRDMIGDNPTEE